MVTFYTINPRLKASALFLKSAVYSIANLILNTVVLFLTRLKIFLFLSFKYVNS